MPDAFLDAFSAALAGDDAVLAPWWADAEHGLAGLSVYRNTVAKGCADALAGLFPAVAAVVGPDWVREAAIRFAAAHPPARASLIDYGEAFPDWLADFEPAADMPYLPGLARLDRMWTEAHLAADADPLEPQALAGLTPEDFAVVRAVLHPSARLAAFDDGTPTLWAALRAEGGPPAELALDAEPQAVLVVRPGGAVTHHILTPGALAFLIACAAEESLGEAAAVALAEEPDLDLSQAFAALIAAGAFSALTFPDS